jgi:K+-sensing histidine kinase KdpD
VNSLFDTLIKDLNTRPNPKIYRALAVAFILTVAATDKLLGGTWMAVGTASLITCAAFVVLPTSKQAQSERLKLATRIERLYSLPTWLQMAIALGLFAVIELIDHQIGGLRLGSAFNFYLAAIFVHCLCFGFRSFLLVWSLATVIVYFVQIPPEYSFKIESLNAFLYIMLFVFLGIIAASAAFLIRVSSTLYETMDARH